MAYKKSYTKTKIETDRHKNKRHKKNNTSYSPTTIVSTKNPATQITYKKNLHKHRHTDTDTQTQTQTQTKHRQNTDKTQRQKEKKHRQRHRGQER